MQFVDAFVEAEHAADGKQHQRDKEGPEVDLLAVQRVVGDGVERPDADELIAIGGMSDSLRRASESGITSGL